MALDQLKRREFITLLGAERHPTSKRRSVLALGLHPTVKKQAEAPRPRTWGARNRSSRHWPEWDHGKLNAFFEQDGEVQALYREAAGFDQSQGKTVR